MGAFQLPDSVTNAAIGCLLYSSFCLIANVVLVWLIWVHRERTSYVAFISYLTLLATVSSLVQQLYDYILWVDIMTWQFWYGKENCHDAAVQYHNEIFGLKLALSHIRIFCFMAEASLVFFFSLALAATVYGWWAQKSRNLRNLSFVGRVIPITLGIISIVLLQLEFTHKSFFVYFAIANAQYIISLCGACIFLVMILFKYLQTRRRLHTWLTLDYGKATLTTTASSTARSGEYKRSRACSGMQPSATFDKWLVVRLSIAFMTLCIFEWTNISPRVKNRESVLASVNETGPDLSHTRAMSTVTGYLSGVSPSLLAFLVFGTTKAFQRKMYRTFIPQFLRKQNDTLTSMDPRQLPFSSTNNSSYARASTVIAPQTPKHYRSNSSVFTAPPQTPRHHRSSSSIRSPPEAVVLTPITPKTPREVPRAPHRQFRSGSLTRKPEPIIVEELPSVSLRPIYEPRGAAWLEDESPPESLCRSEIGVAVSTCSPSTNAAATPRRAPTFFRDADEDGKSMKNAEIRESRGGGPMPSPQWSIPLSRFNNNGVDGGHKRRISETGSFTQIWSEGRRPSGGRQDPSSARSAVGQVTMPGRAYYNDEAPVRRGSAA